MTLDQPPTDVVQAVVVYDGQLLLVAEADAWGLPTGGTEPAESAEAAAARIVYELTAYLVDGSPPLEPRSKGSTAVVCHPLTEDPSGSGSLPSERLRWVLFTELDDIELPPAVREYVRGHTPA
ncbi:hypothetical protein DSC45_05405 [Streptomyces sp. YIM 130001]|uniref:NUDIX domain-containing protein n=1 Tax=Streptomyces sp. YIM 130001 TaxID=2259644 RepID=UPI000E6599D6|nr:NUDIX domain-containing protein [Streptomyces sp. YIM 130001]RII20644.1 hypothetical protein DSC45_05405 [Streptomyces sp. YIM 130001]